MTIPRARSLSHQRLCLRPTSHITPTSDASPPRFFLRMGREGLALTTVMRTTKREPSEVGTYYVLGGHDLTEFFHQPHALGPADPVLQRWKLRHGKIAGLESTPST